MIVTEEEAKKIKCPMAFENSQLLNGRNCSGTNCMAFTHVGVRHDEPDYPDRTVKTYRCGMTNLRDIGVDDYRKQVLKSIEKYHTREKKS